MFRSSLRPFVIAGALLLVGCQSVPAEEPAVASEDASGDAAAPPPNFVVFIADDHGERDLGCYGHRVLQTPNIDRLARQGMRFDAAFLTISSCSPSRASILTGRYPHNTGAEDLHTPLPTEQWTIARHLARSEYHRVAVGKWHLGPAERRHWSEIETCRGADTGANAVRLLRERPRDKPFFFWVASVDPHRPFDTRATEPAYDPASVVLPPYLPEHPAIRQEIADYYGEVSRFDRHVGEVFVELEKQGELDRTFIVYLSDNGMPFPRAKTTLYDSGIRTPFIVRYPSLVRAGSVQRGLISSIDLAPTILELAGVDAESTRGRSLVPMLRDSEAPGREAIFAEANWHDFEKFTRAVRTSRYLLVRNYYRDVPLWNSVDSVNSATWRAYLEVQRRGGLSEAQKFLFLEPRPFEELYDLQIDPSPLENVVDEERYRGALAELRTRLDNWRVETQDAMPAERRRDGWTRDGRPLPHNQPWYDRWKEQGRSTFEKF